MTADRMHLSQEGADLIGDAISSKLMTKNQVRKRVMWAQLEKFGWTEDRYGAMCSPEMTVRMDATTATSTHEPVVVEGVELKQRFRLNPLKNFVQVTIRSRGDTTWVKLDTIQWREVTVNEALVQVRTYRFTPTGRLVTLTRVKR